MICWKISIRKPLRQISTSINPAVALERPVRARGVYAGEANGFAFDMAVNDFEIVAVAERAHLSVDG
jgi:hypothetical protein